MQLKKPYFFFGPLADSSVCRVELSWEEETSADVVAVLVFGEMEIFFSLLSAAAAAATGAFSDTSSLILCGVGGDFGSADDEAAAAALVGDDLGVLRSGEEADFLEGDAGGVFNSGGLRRVELRLRRGILLLVERLRVTTETRCGL